MQRLIVLLGSLTLVACQDKGPDAGQVMAQGDKLTRPLPGLYRSTTRLTAFELPGADPETADTMHERFAQVLPQRRDVCLTPQAAGRGFADVIRQSQQGDCTVERFVADKSRLSAKMSCRGAAKLRSTVSVEGTGEPARSHIELEIVQTGPSLPGGSETIAMTIDNVRLGDCPQ